MNDGPFLNRRAFIGAIGGAALIGLPGLARAQAAGKMWRVGFLGLNATGRTNLDAFRDQMRSLGYVEGSNLAIVYRIAEGKEERLAEMATELAGLKVDAIVTVATQAALAAKRATRTIPIVMATAGDPVGTGVIASLSRPGGNATGMSNQSTELAGKRLQLLREILPRATRVAILPLKGTPLTPLLIAEFRAAAKQFGITLSVHEVNTIAALPQAFAAMQRARAQALIVPNSPFSGENRERIASMAMQQRLVTMFDVRGAIESGGLIAYGPNISELYRRAAYYLDRIFKGASPADLPVEQPSKYEMIINLKTARALGIKVPQAVLVRADEVIQ